MNSHFRFAIKTAKKAGRTLYETFREEEPIIRGANGEIKTFYDRLTDKIIKEAIEKKYPKHSYLTEETGLVDKGSDYLWIIDPLDGTGNFINHNPLFSVSIALWRKGEPLFGVIEVPMLDERYTTIRGKGAFHHDLLTGKKQQAKVSKIRKLDKSYFLYCEGSEEKKERIVNIFKKNYPKAKEMRKLGSAAIELAWVGLGRAEGYCTTQISLWDIAAGILFVKEAGGQLFKFNNKPYQWKDFTLNKKFNLLATNKKVKIKIS